ncbi:hypothetical protein ACQ4PT_031552 [Festuca glaucescens]
MSGADLQRVMDMLGSARRESQLGLLRAGALLDRLYTAVAVVHRHGAVRKGGNAKLTLCIGSLSASLGDALEAVLNQQTSGVAWHQVPAIVFRNHQFRRATVRRLKRCLEDFVTLACYISEEYAPDVIRYDPLPSSSSSSAAISTLTTQAVGGPIVGRWALVEEMVSRILAAGSGGAGPLVLPIVGGPGIGKTRLAQALFRDGRVKRRFKVRRWVHVSPKLQLATILMRISKRGLSADDFQLSRTTMKILIRDALLGGSYLLVLDDVWSDTAGGSARGSLELEVMFQALPPNGAIILTTRTPSLASRMASGAKPYYLLPLGEKLSTSLSSRWTSSYGGICPPELIQEAGVMIAKKCEGVPFLLEYACRLLCLPQLTMDFWSRFVGNTDDGDGHTDIGNLWRQLPSYIDMLPEEQFWQRFLQHCNSLPNADLVVKSASVSYQHLPFDLRGCLAYCSLFPLGYTFDAEQLAELLAIEGFIPPTVTNAQRRGFLKVLLDDCFCPLQEHGGTSTTYRMHSMLHIFARYMDREFISVNTVAGQVTHITSRGRAQRSVRHVSMIVHPSVTSFHADLFSYRDLRTLILLHQGDKRLPDQPQCEIKVIPPDFCLSLQTLQVLSLESTKIGILPSKFDQLSSLRYLNLSRSDIEILPRSVSKLQSLQILILSRCEKLQRLHNSTTKLSRLHKLDLEGCRHLVELPQDMSKMRSLGHLNLLGCSLLTQLPRGVGQLYNLHTLLGYVTPICSDGRNISELQAMPYLQRVSLECLDKVKAPLNARNAKLGRKRNLESLQLRWNAESVGELAYAVLESLQPPQHLKVLEIVSYEGDKFPTWLRGSQAPYLTSLVEIRLVNLRACDKMLPPLGILPCLKIVEISGAEDIDCVDDSFYGNSGTFSSLERLTLSFMPNLQVWEEQRAGTFPRLAELAIIQCPKFRALHVELPSVEKLTLWMNNEMLCSSRGGLRGVAASLKHVSISFCEELLDSSVCEALHDLARVEKLDICGCHGLASLPQGFQHLSSLIYLTVDNCSNMKTLPGWLENLSHLRLLHLSGCAVLQSIPQGVRQRHDVEIIVEECPSLPGQSGIIRQRILGVRLAVHILCAKQY